MERIKSFKEFRAYRKATTITGSPSVDCFYWYNIALETADKEWEEKIYQLKRVAIQKSDLIAELERKIKQLEMPDYFRQ